MFFAGLATGAAEEVTRGQERIRQRMEQTLQEARGYSKIARQRQEEADAVMQDIRNTSQSYGIDTQVLFSAYRNGHYDQYKGLIDTVRQQQALQGNTATPEMLQSLYEVPASVIENPVDLDTEIKRIFGVIEQGMGEVEPDDVGLGRLLLRGFGVDDGGGLERRSVGGYSVSNLMDMPLPSQPQGDGGRISQSAYPLAAAPREGSSRGPFTPEQITARVGALVTERIRTTLGPEGASDAARQRIQAGVEAEVARRVASIGSSVSYEDIDAQVEDIVRSFTHEAEDGQLFMDTFTTNSVGGERVFQAIDENGVPVPGSRIPESQLPPAGTQEEPEIETTDLEPPEEAGVEQPTELPPEGVPLTANHPEHGFLIFHRIDEDGNAVYLTTDRRPVSFPVN